VRGISFAIRAGEVVGVLGESGCGKSSTALAILSLLPAGAAVTGSAIFQNRDLLSLAEEDLRQIRGAEVSIIFQEPRRTLNPVMRVGQQVAEVIHAHRDWSARCCREEAHAVLARVGLDWRVFESYPHQLSGGQLQRILIAQALACSPALLLADEPTSALDTLTQAGILELLRGLKKGSAISMLLITHHPPLLNELAQRVLVMYAGQIVESGDLKHLYSQPLHPYTAALLACVPPPPQAGTEKRLPAIPGEPVDFAHLPPGCAFAPRCPKRTAACHTLPPLFDVAPSRQVRCFQYAH
jgi:oligopeptide/dipeptide ABC transporter ATP-binding protein